MVAVTVTVEVDGRDDELYVTDVVAALVPVVALGLGRGVVGWGEPNRLDCGVWNIIDGTEVDAGTCAGIEGASIEVY